MTRTGEAGRRAALLDSSRQQFSRHPSKGAIMKTTRLTSTLFGSLAAAVLCASFGTSAAVAQTPAHVMETPGTTKWGPAPPLLPAGAQIAVLAGDPGKAAPYTV